ncbi:MULTISPECIES: quinolinate synthase NadA [unclassified Bacillus (in: firmicutes)]|uniref:quinolinate synthase NadA n=1 Tax=unclassified Bacillus (in: firmicutes) TaxID=185979 RepID=UPI0008E497CB|nr:MULTISPECIES: quinolinate synthase NadA [unclassified Bacillus (in: firmicutes)]SFB15958.1 quinolinate synthetase [Bacillus sp. UNCCL13]SFQ78408.1 quinolinate synthetase [Bacillus sp. cl95]
MKLLDKLAQKKSIIPERYREMSNEDLITIVSSAKKALGESLFIPGHHYQKDEVIRFADATGDSLKLAQLSAQNKNAEYIVFCGVHFMAETADILTGNQQKVILPDMRAGCSMADMADIYQTERAWKELSNVFGDSMIPLTYINSTAAIKAFVGRNGGATVTSSNATEMVSWALQQKERILFLPDQHLGRNTAVTLGIGLDEMAVWNPILNQLEFDGELDKVKIILWKGHCSVHENFTVQNIKDIRSNHPEMKIIVHPECTYDVVKQADMAGSTSYIINQIEQSAKGSSWAIGTEMNLVQRIIKDHPDKKIVSLNPHMCPCLTMNRIDLPHLAWCLESIVSGEIHNEIKVEENVAQEAILALNRMLELS